MSDIVPIDITALRRHLEILHRLAAAEPGPAEPDHGCLRLSSGGLDPTRPRPLAPVAQNFTVGAVDPMTEAAARLNREAGRNVMVPFALFDDAGAVRAVLGFSFALVRAPGWMAMLPYAPSGAIAAGDQVWPVFLFDRPADPAAALAVAHTIAEFAGAGTDDQALLAGTPLAGGCYTTPSGSSAAVEIELPFRTGYRLDQLALATPGGGPGGGGPGGAGPDPRIGLVAIPATTGGQDHAAAAPGGGPPGGDPPPPPGDDDDDNDEEAAWFGRFALRLRAGHRTIEIGSDIAIAELISRELAAALGEIVAADGGLWRYLPPDGSWSALDDDILRRLAHSFDGAAFQRPSGRLDAVQLNKTRVVSIIDAVSVILRRRDFFEREPAFGINCANGFLRLDGTGEVELVPHQPRHRRRHTIAASWDKWLAEAAEDPPRDSLLGTLLNGCFGGDVDFEDKARFAAEMLGAAASGCITRLPRPKAVICHGPKAENGKGQWLDLLRAMLPARAVTSIPANKLGDDKYAVQLVGKALNACDELTNASAIARDAFKKIITGDPVTARDVYKSAITFRPRALHCFACNQLPSFTGGFDNGVRSRLALLDFTRTIPPDERIPGLGRRVAAEEAELLLGFAVAGAQRLLRQKAFTVPPSSAVALRDWFITSDPVAAWARARLRPRNPADFLPGARDFGILTTTMYEDFDRWQKDAGYGATLKLVGFSRRLLALAPFLSRRHTKARNFIKGGVIGDPPDADEEDEELTVVHPDAAG